MLLPLPLILWPAGCSTTAKCAAGFDPPTKFTVEEVLPSATELYRVVRTDSGEAVASLMGESLSLSKAVRFVASDGTMLANVRQAFLSNNLEFFDCTGDKIADVVMPTPNSSPGKFMVRSDTMAEVFRTVEGPWWSPQQWITVNAMDVPLIEVNDGSKARAPGTLLVRMSQEKSGLAHHAEVEVLASSVPNATQWAQAAEIEATGAAGRRLFSASSSRRAPPVDPVVIALFASVSYQEVGVLAAWRVVVAVLTGLVACCVISCLAWRQVGKELLCSIFAGGRYSPVQDLPDEGYRLAEQPGAAAGARRPSAGGALGARPEESDQERIDQERRIAELKRKKEDFQRRKADQEKEELRLAEERRKNAAQEKQQREEDERRKAAEREEQKRRQEDERRKAAEREEQERRQEDGSQADAGGAGEEAHSGLPEDEDGRGLLEKARAEADAERQSLELARGQAERERRELEEERRAVQAARAAAEKEREELARLRQEALHPAPVTPARAVERDRAESADTVYSSKSIATAYEQHIATAHEQYDQTAPPSSEYDQTAASSSAAAEDEGHFRPARATA